MFNLEASGALQRTSSSWSRWGRQAELAGRETWAAACAHGRALEDIVPKPEEGTIQGEWEGRGWGTDLEWKVMYKWKDFEFS